MESSVTFYPVCESTLPLAVTARTARRPPVRAGVTVPPWAPAYPQGRMPGAPWASEAEWRHAACQSWLTWNHQRLKDKKGLSCEETAQGSFRDAVPRDTGWSRFKLGASAEPDCETQTDGRPHKVELRSRHTRQTRNSRWSFVRPDQ